jgi:hypothetical protein
MNKFASLVKSAELYKSATKWKELLRAGQLSTRSLARIMNTAGAEKKFLSKNVDTLNPIDKANYGIFSNNPLMSRFGKDYFLRSAEKIWAPRQENFKTITRGKAVKQLAETVKANPKGLYVKPATPEIATPLANRQLTESDYAGKMLNQISQGLKRNSGRDFYDHGMFPHYQKLVKDKMGFSSISKAKSTIRNMRSASTHVTNSESPIAAKIVSGQLNDLTPDQAMALMSHQAYKLAPLRKTHRLSGSSSIFDKKMFKDKSLEEQMKLFMNGDKGSPALMPSHYNSITKSIISPLGIGSPITRHEIGHGLFDRGTTAYRVDVAKRIHEMLKRHPEVQKELLKNNTLGLLHELSAQVIAGRGGSRSAQRFIKQYHDYGYNFTPYVRNKSQNIFGRKVNLNIDDSRGLPYLNNILRKADKLDPSGLDSAMITQLVNNYKLSLPRSAAK